MTNKPDTNKPLFHKKPEVYDFVATNIGKQSVHKPIKRLAVASLQSQIERTRVAEKVAKHYAKQNKKVLLIKTDLATVSRDLNGGLTHLLAQLAGRPVTRGQVLDYGLLDLFFLIYFQGLTGDLYLTGHREHIYHAVFNQGILCHIDGPDFDLRKNLPYFENYGFDKIKKIKQKASKKAVPLIDLLMQIKGIGKKDLALGYKNDLINAFKALPVEKISTFRFESFRLKHWQKIGLLFNNEFVLEHEKLKSHHFVSRCIRLNIHQKDSLFYVMARGTHAEKFGSTKTYQTVTRLMKVLGQFFDYIVVDANALQSGSDGEAFSRLSDGTILVIDGARDSVLGVKRMIKRLNDDGVTILGTVLSQANVKI